MKHQQSANMPEPDRNSTSVRNRKAVSGIRAGFALACVCLTGIFTSGAAAQGVNFNGFIREPNACIIIVLNNGTMTPDPTASILSSKNGGGVAGLANVISFTNYRVWLDAPPFFTAKPPGFDDSGTTFATTFSGTSIFRGRNFADRPGTRSRRLRRGFSITQITAHLIATNPVPYATGNYASFATLRCE